VNGYLPVTSRSLSANLANLAGFQPLIINSEIALLLTGNADSRRQSRLFSERAHGNKLNINKNNRL
jgi:hypothetical protein